jgi:mannose/fructose-specific phosphotransferase system component IIA
VSASQPREGAGVTPPPVRVPALIVTHADLAQALVRAAERVVGSIEDVTLLSNEGLSRDDLEDAIEACVQGLEGRAGCCSPTSGAGSCHTCGASAARRHGEVVIVTGINLPLLLDYLHNRDRLSAPELAERSAEGSGQHPRPARRTGVSWALHRIDDRLIHGQVLVAWGARLDPARIWVVDDGVGGERVGARACSARRRPASRCAWPASPKRRPRTPAKRRRRAPRSCSCATSTPRAVSPRPVRASRNGTSAGSTTRPARRR